MREPITSHRLNGLEPDNLLAFLALLGLLRSLELAHPNWRPKVYWALNESPLRPVLTTYGSTTEGMVCDAAVDGLRIFRQVLFPFRHELPGKEGLKKELPKKQDKPKSEKLRKALIRDRAHQRSLAKRCIMAQQVSRLDIEKRTVWRLRCDLVACSAANVIKKDKEIETTPMKLTSGNMPFIGTMFELADKCEAGDLQKSIFGNWEYANKGNSLRFSPDEAQRYAYRATDPSDEGAYTEFAATALSGLGLLSFPMVERGSYWKMPAYSGTSSKGRICWPIWGSEGGNGSSLSTIEAMLRALPLEQGKSPKLFGTGAMVTTARRYALDPNQPYYGNISRAEIEVIA